MTALLEVRHLVTEFGSGPNGALRAVNDVSFAVEKGKILGLVGESGSGKSVTGFSIMGLVDRPGRISGGEIRFEGHDICRYPEEQMRQLRGNRIAMIFQDPMMTLDPVLTIGTQMVETVRAHAKSSYQEAWQRSKAMLELVGIPGPAERLSAYPHEFSGGMRQRVAIAIALLHRPALIIADEPTTALDVTIQSQIIFEFQKLTRMHGTSVIWITHDLAVASRLADTIAVMYAGRIVEQGSAEEVLLAPAHPYTRGLLDSVPSRNQRGRPLKQIPGMTPALDKLPSGCSFRPRCPRADGACIQVPDERTLGSRVFRCHHPVV